MAGAGRVGMGLLAAWLALSIGPSTAQAPGQGSQIPGGIHVDLELVLAVDVSQSMVYDEHELQKNGYVEAFRDDRVIRAITGGHEGKIAVAYLEWGGAFDPTPTIPWTIIDSAASARAFADRLSKEPVISEQRTSISNALLASTQLIQTNVIAAHRQVIDISGDGPNNTGPQVDEVRDAVVKQGIQINGLPILLNKPRQYYDIDHLDRYYKDCVIGGEGAFMAPVYDLKQLASTIRKKLVMEIAGIEIDTGAAPVQFASAPPKRTPDAKPGDLKRVQLKLPAGKFDCLAGENAVGGGYRRYGYP